MSLELSPPCTYIVRKPIQKPAEKHPTVVRAEQSRRGRNESFWKALADYRATVAGYEADDDPQQAESWQERILASERKLLMISVTSASAIRVKLEIADDPATYGLPGVADSVLQMIRYDLESMSMLELTGCAYAGELV